jgi:hypothetical protein
MRRLLPWLPSLLLLPVALGGAWLLLRPAPDPWPRELLIAAPAAGITPTPTGVGLPRPDLPAPEDIQDPGPLLGALIDLAVDDLLEPEQIRTLLPLLQEGGLLEESRMRLREQQLVGRYGLVQTTATLLGALSREEFERFRAAALDPDAPMRHWDELAAELRKRIASSRKAPARATVSATPTP